MENFEVLAGKRDKGIKMTSELKCFVKQLIMHFSNRDDIYYVHYDGEREPKLVDVDFSNNILSEAMSGPVYEWVGDYINRRELVNYYEMYQHLVNEFCGVWVNPTCEELSVWNQNMNLFPTTNLSNTQSFQKDWQEAIHRTLLDEFEEAGYKVVSGNELIEQLVRMYDQHSSKNMSIVDWIKPTDISLLKNNHSYLIDREIDKKPILLTKQHILERENQNFSIGAGQLWLYFEHLQVTKRGLESEELIDDPKIVFHFYSDIKDYLNQVDSEREASTLRKLVNNEVDPYKPFIEAVIDNYSEIYINEDAIETEKDLLDFVNNGYLIEEIDLEAKSFNRKEIIKELLCKSATANRYITIRRKDSIH